MCSFGDIDFQPRNVAHHVTRMQWCTNPVLNTLGHAATTLDLCRAIHTHPRLPIPDRPTLEPNNWDIKSHGHFSCHQTRQQQLPHCSPLLLPGLCPPHQHLLLPLSLPDYPSLCLADYRLPFQFDRLPQLSTGRFHSHRPHGPPLHLHLFQPPSQLRAPSVPPFRSAPHHGPHRKTSYVPLLRPSRPSSAFHRGWHRTAGAAPTPLALVECL